MMYASRWEEAVVEGSLTDKQTRAATMDVFAASFFAAAGASCTGSIQQMIIDPQNQNEFDQSPQSSLQ